MATHALAARPDTVRLGVFDARIPPVLTIASGDSVQVERVSGPIAIAGAMPGDMLEVRIEAIEPGANWGYNAIAPLMGTLPEDFHERVLMHFPVDRAAGTCRLPWGTELKLAPFFGVMGVAPPPAFGTIMSKEPRLHGGNMDNK